jgi:hypothetical protein
MNLPPTSIRDLVVHGDDVVVGTHGRSFWILDNITPLRQLSEQSTKGAFYFFKPQLTYRLRRNNTTDTPLPPEEPAGQNPPDGAMIDYWLKDAASAPVRIEITDERGNLVRSFDSVGKPEPVNEKDFNVPMYWVRPPRTLSAAAGMHRFIWDLTYPAPEVLTRDYPISAIYRDTPLYPLGATVLPGKYMVSFSNSGGKIVVKQPLEIRMDPRVKTTAEDLHRQFELDRKIADALHKDYEALQQVRGLRAQLKVLAEHGPSKNAKLAAIAKTAAELEAKAAPIEGEEGDYATRYLSTPEGRSLARLNGGLNALVSALDSADAAPTTQQSAMFGELTKALEEQLSAWALLKSKDISELNEKLKKAGLPLLDLQKPVPGAADGVKTTTQDRDQNEE